MNPFDMKIKSRSDKYSKIDPNNVSYRELNEGNLKYVC